MMLIKSPPRPLHALVLLPFLFLLSLSRPSALRLANTGAWNLGSPPPPLWPDFPGTLGTHPKRGQSQAEAKTAWSPAGEARGDRAWKAPSCPAQFFSEGVGGALRCRRREACPGCLHERHGWGQILSGLPLSCALSPLDPAELLATQMRSSGAHPSCCACVCRSSRHTA